MLRQKAKRHLLVSLQWSKLVQGPRLRDSSLKLEVHDKGALASQELHQELDKNVEYIGLVDVSDRVTDQCPLGMHY